MTKQPIILFDGVCNLCNAAVQFVLRYDKKEIFVFASLQSNAGQTLLQKFNLPATDFNSFVLIDNDKLFLKSSAALHVAKKMGGAISWLYGFIITPIFIRDTVYNIIAKNRYKWFGKKETCMVPTAVLQKRFLK
ncbi:MAG: DCC1-like thiol-disulfide oxidoreductase family protein [Ferruginibacter sp.]|nr:DUF393 domain-containing protein [Ferruginibacter sp.]